MKAVSLSTPFYSQLRRRLTLNISHKHVTWSVEDNEYLGLCAEFPSLSWLAKTQEEALVGISQVVLDMQNNGEEAYIPVLLSERKYGGEFRVRIPSEVHRALAIQAA